MGGAKIPGIEVKTPKGVAKTRERRDDHDEKAEEKETETTKEEWIQGRQEANKRYRSREGRQNQEVQTNDKRQRRLSPIKQQKEGKLKKEEKKPTNFFQVLMASRYQRSDLPGDTGGPRTPVRKKIQKLGDQNRQQLSAKWKRGTGGQGRQPSPLQEGK